MIWNSKINKCIYGIPCIYGNNSKMFLKILIVRIPSLGRILDLTKDMNDQMIASDFRRVLTFCKNKTQPDMFIMVRYHINIATSLPMLSLFGGNYEM